MLKHDSTTQDSPINWECKGKFSFTSGFGATKAEIMIGTYTAFTIPVVLYFLNWQTLDWSVLQIAVAAFLTMDMVGGVISNSLGSMKRFLHTKEELDIGWTGKLVGSKFLFPAIHFQLFAIPACFDVTWSYAFGWYGLMMVSIVLLHFIPMYLHRSIALTVVMLAIILTYLTPAPVGLEWLAPIFILKLVLSHGVREEPYRPTANE
ncbi:hypothetical protein [uncultured Vibrio sp.]|uniref:hypothetical protein n=1 Tax=uncultured Vibrio sp. TaxID=114054 RepID=UPI0025FC665C|nr:hypothetical protein [uncultured Vibrio sp.]